MKYRLITKKKTYKPVTVSLTFETLEELQEFYLRMNIDVEYLTNQQDSMVHQFFNSHETESNITEEFINDLRKITYEETEN